MSKYFKKHFTKEEKKIRRLCYQLLRSAGFSPEKARLFRDWKEKKVIMLILGEAKPIR